MSRIIYECNHQHNNNSIWLNQLLCTTYDKREQYEMLADDKSQHTVVCLHYVLLTEDYACIQATGESIDVILTFRAPL